MVSKISPVIKSRAPLGETYLISQGDQINRNMAAKDTSHTICLKRSVKDVSWNKMAHDEQEHRHVEGVIVGQLDQF